MIPTSLLSGVLELIALLGSTLRSPGAASGMRLSWTYCDRSLCPPKSAPGARAGTSASESAKTLPATVAPATLVEAAVRNLLRDKPPRSEGFATVSRLDVMRSSPFGLTASARSGRLRRDRLECGRHRSHVRRDGLPESMPLGKPARVVVGQPNLARCVLINERFQRQIYPYRLVSLHQRCAALGVAEDEELGRPQRQADRGGSGRVVDSGEHGHAKRFDFGLQPIHGLLRTEVARYSRQTTRRHDQPSA